MIGAHLVTIFLIVSTGIVHIDSQFRRIIKVGERNRAINQNPLKINIIFDDEAPSTNAPPCRTPDQGPGLCKSLAECAIFFAGIPTLLDDTCITGSGQEGVCCPARSSINTKRPRPGLSSDGVLSSPPVPRVKIPEISQQELLSAVDNSIRSFTQRQNSVNKILFEDNIQVLQGSPAESHNLFFETSNTILDQGNKAQLNIEASKTLVKDFKLSKLQGTFALPQISARNTLIGQTCPALSQCQPGFPYRTIDGSCNNVENADWGKAGGAFQRILPPKYGDGVSSPRTDGFRGPLPSPRLISSSFHADEDRPYNNITLMLMQWGQFLDHDITFTPIVKGVNSTGISCCSNGQPLQSQFRHPDCFSIDIPRNDPFFGQFRQECMDFVRSLPAPRRGCNFGPREQMSQITAFIDGSNIYGSDDRKASSLREFEGGRLLAQKRQGKDLLPGNPSECSDQRQRSCFKAGDARVNEQIDLALMHTVWLREHNRIANTLQNLNPKWSDEILFQETRRIVIAEIQHITYNEFLPLILGPDYTRTFNLTPVEQGHSKLYNPQVDPTITNAFAAAAYRFGHSLVQGIIQGFNKFGTVSQEFAMKDTQFQPFAIYDKFDDLARGLASQGCQRFDNFVSKSLTNHLFQGTEPFGLDLIALNIQRGRDHGLPPYNDWREVCGLSRLDNWEDLEGVTNQKAIDQLRRIYSSVEDIDLFVGGLAEKPMQDAILGPVLVCLVGDQFARLRRGDRFYYEEPTARFTKAQLNQIRKMSLARIICDNGDDITVIQPLVMQKASVLNRRLPCSKDIIPAIDLSFWKEFRKKPNNQNLPQQTQTLSPIQQNQQNIRPVQQNQNFRPVQQNQNFGPVQQNQNFRPVQQNQNFQPIQQNQNFQPTQQNQNFITQQPSSPNIGFGQFTQTFQPGAVINLRPQGFRQTSDGRQTLTFGFGK